MNRRASDGGANIHSYLRQMTAGNSQTGSVETLPVRGIAVMSFLNSMYKILNLALP
ncbi:hypothetical protein DPMN_075830 [Dreissena polymorpha]|uniref:Uncharacterized protein n=1 Tax=Dreissena polymorpha TaxID=45954 RepID=A0A9D4BLV3_DREPO|nr:hypothetical protein DPMN_075830 [Dreissena polymorpha]